MLLNVCWTSPEKGAEGLNNLILPKGFQTFEMSFKLR